MTRSRNSRRQDVTNEASHQGLISSNVVSQEGNEDNSNQENVIRTLRSVNFLDIPTEFDVIAKYVDLPACSTKLTLSIDLSPLYDVIKVFSHRSFSLEGTIYNFDSSTTHYDYEKRWLLVSVANSWFDWHVDTAELDTMILQLQGSKLFVILIDHRQSSTSCCDDRKEEMNVDKILLSSGDLL